MPRWASVRPCCRSLLLQAFDCGPQRCAPAVQCVCCSTPVCGTPFSQTSHPSPAPCPTWLRSHRRHGPAARQLVPGGPVRGALPRPLQRLLQVAGGAGEAGGRGDRAAGWVAGQEDTAAWPQTACSDKYAKRQDPCHGQWTAGIMRACRFIESMSPTPRLPPPPSPMRRRLSSCRSSWRSQPTRSWSARATTSGGGALLLTLYYCNGMPTPHEVNNPGAASLFEHMLSTYRCIHHVLLAAGCRRCAAMQRATATTGARWCCRWAASRPAR